MDFGALHEVIRRRWGTSETAMTELSLDEASSTFSPGEASALALLWQHLGQVGGDIDKLLARIGVLEWAVPPGKSVERH